MSLRSDRGGRITRRMVLWAVVVGLGLSEFRLGPWFRPDAMWFEPVPYALAWTMFAVTLTIAVVFADEACDRGWRALAAYPAAVTVALVLCSIVTGVAWQLFPAWFDPRRPFSWFRILSTTVDWAEYGGFAVAGYVNRRAAQRVLDGVREAQLRRIRSEQDLVAARLAATEAQMDPQLLVESLSDICAALERSDSAAELRLDQLIQSLRTALTRTIAASGGQAVRP